MSAENTDEPEDATANYLQDPEAAEPHPRGGRTSSPSPSRGFLGGSENAPTDGPAVDDLVDQLIVPPASVENSGRMAESQGAHPGGDTPNEAAPAAAGAHADHDRGDLANGHAPEKNVQEGLGGDGKSSSSSSSSSSDDSEPSDFELRANPAPVEQAPKVNDGGWGNEDDLDEDDDPAEDVPAKDAPRAARRNAPWTRRSRRVSTPSTSSTPGPTGSNRRAPRRPRRLPRRRRRIPTGAR